MTREETAAVLVRAAARHEAMANALGLWANGLSGDIAAHDVAVDVLAAQDVFERLVELQQIGLELRGLCVGKLGWDDLATPEPYLWPKPEETQALLKQAHEHYQAMADAVELWRLGMEPLGVPVDEIRKAVKVVLDGITDVWPHILADELRGACVERLGWAIP
jgi:hypothetical protein